MFKKIRRIFRSLFGWLLRRVEDPELTLRQLMDDMRSKVPEMNENVARVMTMEKLLQADADRLEESIAKREESIKTAVQMMAQAAKYEQAARSLIAANEADKQSLEKTRQQLEAAKAASEKAKEFRRRYLTSMEEKRQECLQLIAENRRAKMQEQFSQLLTSFEVGDEAGTLDEMRARIKERAALAESKAELATGESLDYQIAKIEQQTTDLKVDQRLREYQRQLGLVPEAEVAKSMGEVEAPPQPTQQVAEPPAQAQEGQTTS